MKPLRYPTMHWVHGSHPDGIFNSLFHGLQGLGFPGVGEDAEIVVLSAGAPYWQHPGHDRPYLERLLETDQRVIVTEMHEYGWGTYNTPALVDQFAWMARPDYGQGIEIHGKRWEGEHGPLRDFLVTLVATQPDRLIYLRREVFRGWPYPDGLVWPVNFTLQAAHDSPPNREQFLTRPFMIKCAWGETNPVRAQIARRLELLVKSFSGEIRSPVYIGDTGRLPPGAGYVDWHKDAKLFVTADGHGLGGGREWELIPHLAMLRKQSLMVVHDDFVDQETCLQFGTPDDCHLDEMEAKLRWVEEEPEAIWAIHEKAYHHAHRHHTLEGQAEYVASIMAARGWFEAEGASSVEEMRVRAYGPHEEFSA